MKKILRYDYEGLPAINSQAPLWYALLHENQYMAPEYAKRLTTEDEVAVGWTSRFYFPLGSGFPTSRDRPLRPLDGFLVNFESKIFKKC